MDLLKTQLQKQLLANMLKEICREHNEIIFRENWCSQERVIRFATPFFRKLFDYKGVPEGFWKTGDAVMYEINNLCDKLEIICHFCPFSREYPLIDAEKKLLEQCGITRDTKNPDYILRQWMIDSSDGDVNILLQKFSGFLDITLAEFEKSLENNRCVITDKNPPEVFKEGGATYTTLNRYERNAKAREACLKANGTACAVCGFDFGKTFGPEFSGKIEVHHIIPISEIGEEYIVDPVHDLVPVCPNCHMALHSKKDGVYTIEELKRHYKKGS